MDFNHISDAEIIEAEIPIVKKIVEAFICLETVKKCQFVTETDMNVKQQVCRFCFDNGYNIRQLAIQQIKGKKQNE